MSEHEFTVKVTVDDEDLAEYNRQSATSRSGVPIPDDPSEWDGNDLVHALDWIDASAEITDYRAILAPGEAVAADIAARKAARA